MEIDMATKTDKQLSPEDEVLRRMLHTPPTPHKEKLAPAKKKPAAKRPTPRKPWD
jgi:hypothetical protein